MNPLELAKQAEMAQMMQAMKNAEHGSIRRDYEGERRGQFEVMNNANRELLMGAMPMAGMTRSGTWFHGTPHQGRIEKLKGREPTYAGSDSVDNLLGPHFSKDTNISNKFAVGLYRDKKSIGQSIPVSISGKAKKINNSGVQDYQAIAKDMAKTLFDHPNAKDMFRMWLMINGMKRHQEAGQIWEKLRRGESVKARKGSKSSNTIEDYMESVSPLHKSLADSSWVGMYKDILKKKGYTHLEYQNTAKFEVGSARIVDRKTGKILDLPASKNDTSAVVIDDEAISMNFGNLLKSMKKAEKR